MRTTINTKAQVNVLDRNDLVIVMTSLVAHCFHRVEQQLLSLAAIAKLEPRPRKGRPTASYWAICSDDATPRPSVFGGGGQPSLRSSISFSS